MPRPMGCISKVSINPTNRPSDRSSPYEQRQLLNRHYHYRRKDYEKATEALHKVNQPDFLWTEIFFAAAYSQMQRPEDATRAVRHLQELKPGFSLATLADESHIWNLPQSMVRQLTEDLRKAGVPEGKR